MRQTQIVNFELTLPFALLRVLLNSKYWNRILNVEKFGETEKSLAREKKSTCVISVF